MQKKGDIEDQEDQIYRFEEMDVDIIIPELQNETKEINPQTQKQEDVNIEKQLQELKQTYIFRQKLEPSLMNQIRGKKGARRQKKLRTIQFSNINNPKSKKQNIETLVEERKNKQFQERIFLLSQLRIPFQCTLQVEKQGVFNFQPIYRLFNTKESKFILSCQKQSTISSKYIFSSSLKRISRHEISYFGQLVSLDYMNNHWILYDHGFNPEKVREIDQCRTQLLYAQSYNNCIGFTSNTNMKVITPSNLHLMRQYKPFEGQSNLLEKYSKQNPHKVYDYRYQRNNINQYFKKRLFDIPINNGFILIPEGSQTPLLYFGKRGQGKYSLEIHPPLSIFQSFALCILHLRLTN